MYANFPDINQTTSYNNSSYSNTNPINTLVTKYNDSLQNIEQLEMNRSVDPMFNQQFAQSVDEFFNVKKQISNVYNNMRAPLFPQYTQSPSERSLQCDTRQQQQRAMQQQPPTTIFLNDLFTGQNGGFNTDKGVRNIIEENPYQQAQLQQQQNYANSRKFQQNSPDLFLKKCVNSSFDNRLNQPQFNSNSDVVFMQTDNGSVVPIDNADMLSPNAMKCGTYSPNNISNGYSFNPLSAPVLASISKNQYMNNLAAEFNRQNSVRNTSLNEKNWVNSPLNNPNNPIWKPMDSKYLN